MILYIMDYRSKIYDILNKQRSHMLEAIPQPTMIYRGNAGDKPTLHGGIRVMEHPLPGYFLPKDPASLATGSNVGGMRPTDKQDMRRYIQANDLDEDPEMSGGKVKINFKKIGKSIKKVAVPLLKDVGQEVKKQVIPAVTKYGLKAAKDYLLPAAEIVAENPELLLAAAGRNSKKNHKVHRQIYSDSDSDSDAIHVDINSHKGESGVKRPNARAQIVKKVMSSKGLSMCQASAYVKAHGLYKK
jgi:hypothetical protein